MQELSCSAASVDIQMIFKLQNGKIRRKCKLNKFVVPWQRGNSSKEENTNANRHKSPVC